MNVARVLLPACLLFAGSAQAIRFPSAPHGRLATVPATCAFTSVMWVGQRLEDGATHREIPNTGSAIMMANGVYGVDYDAVPAVDRSRRGDPVMTCLAKLPRHCPPGDERGKLYTTTNLRTEESWTLPDAEHRCGGA